MENEITALDFLGDDFFEIEKENLVELSQEKKIFNVSSLAYSLDNILKIIEDNIKAKQLMDTKFFLWKEGKEKQIAFLKQVITDYVKSTTEQKIVVGGIGTFSIRKTVSVDIEDIAEALKELKEQDLINCIAVKTVESIDKKAVKEVLEHNQAVRLKTIRLSHNENLQRR